MTANDPRQRAGSTKRLRTYAACVEAARKLFDVHGWYDTRLSDVAKEAGVSVATLHNHFGTKQALIGHVYRERAERLVQATRQKIADQVDPVDAVEWCIHELATLGRERRKLMLSLLAGLQEQVIKMDGPPVDDDDVRLLVPLPTALVELVAYGQEAGAFSTQHHARDVGTYHTNAIMLRIMTRGKESAEDTARMALDQLMPALLVR